MPVELRPIPTGLLIALAAANAWTLIMPTLGALALFVVAFASFRLRANGRGLPGIFPGTLLPPGMHGTLMGRLRATHRTAPAEVK